MQHRYQIGQMLEMRSSPRLSNRPAGLCEVLFCLPHEGGPLLYRVRSLTENNDRVVAEGDLLPSNGARPVASEGEAVFSIAVNRR